MEVRFIVEPASARASAEALEDVENDILRMIKSRLGEAGRMAWLEAGGYIKFSKGSSGTRELGGCPQGPLLEDIKSDIKELARGK